MRTREIDIRAYFGSQRTRLAHYIHLHAVIIRRKLSNPTLSTKLPLHKYCDLLRLFFITIKAKRALARPNDISWK